MGVPSAVTAFHAEPFTARCNGLRQRGDHALVGVSTGNSYFSAERLTALVRWTQQHFQSVDVICADLHIDTMLIAEGVAPEEAARRARKRVRDVRRRIRQAIEAVSGEGPPPGSHLLSEFQDVPAYRRLRAEIDNALRHDAGFADSCREMVLRYLLKHREGNTGPDREGDLRRLRSGLEYLGSELPFFVDTPSIMGVPSSVSCYHLSTPVIDALFLRETGLRAVANQGFMVVAPEIQDAGTPAGGAPANPFPEERKTT